MFAVDVPITKGYTCILHHGSVQATASVKKLRGLLDKHHRRSCSKHQETSFIDQRKQCSGRDCHRDPSVLGLVLQLQGVGKVHVTLWWKDHSCWNGCRHIMMMHPNRLNTTVCYIFNCVFLRQKQKKIFCVTRKKDIIYLIYD